jgi:amino acid adenylation domain-containing protein
MTIDSKIDNRSYLDLELQDSYPLTPLQQGLLFNNLLYQNSGIDIEQVVCDLYEDLNILAFEQAWQNAVDRHAVLRTSFNWLDFDQPMQQVYGNVHISIDFEDWQRLPAKERDEKFESYLSHDRYAGFDLSQAPLIRLALFLFDKEHYKLVWTFHHSMLDGRSIPIVLNEVFAYYSSLCQNQRLSLPQPKSYKTYIDWLQRLDKSKAETFWRDYLKGFSKPTVPFITEQSTSLTSHTKAYKYETTLLPKEIKERLQALSATYRLTLNTFIQAAWSLLLNRYSNTEDIIFGSIRAGRHSTVEGASSIVGLFINTVPIRVKLSKELSILDCLKELRSHWVQIREFEQTSLADIQRWSSVSSTVPLFNSLVIYERQNWTTSLSEQGGQWQNRRFNIFIQSNYPLILHAYENPEMILNIRYNPCYLESSVAKHMLEHLTLILEKISLEPSQKVSDLQFLTDNEKSQILYDWNSTNTSYPRDTCLSKLFELQAEKKPDALAATFGAEKITYRELNARANQLARYLIKTDITSNRLVGVCIDRSIDMLIAILGILKAGGAYLPLDPTYPLSRLSFIIKDSGSSILLTQKDLAEKFYDQDIKTICLDIERELIAKETKDNLDLQVDTKQTACAFYTSGTTGQPKGITIPHRAINRLVLNTNYVQLKETDTIAQVSNWSFDAATFEIWGALLNGARLSIIDQHTLLSPTKFALQLKEQNITVLFLTTSLFNQFARQLPHAFSSLRYLIFGGEAADPESIKTILKSSPPENLINGYGPTETTTFATSYLVKDINEETKRIPIGKPISNTKVYLLDKDLNPVPCCCPGEIYIGGDGLGNGYINRPDLTAERFIPNPFYNAPEARLFKTGDLAYRLPDGDIQFIRRMDTQVKIRGFRIELEEIEIVLSKHPAVLDNIVVLKEDSSRDKRLVAYATIKNGHIVTTEELRRFLKERLPHYMVPSLFVLLDTLPLNSNGKIDRQSLPSLSTLDAAHLETIYITHQDLSRKSIETTSIKDKTINFKNRTPTLRVETEREYSAATDEIESQLVALWEKILSIKPIGIRDNFFEIGGHSLLAVQLFIEIERLFKKELPLATLFQAPTIESLAKLIRNESSKSLNSSLVAIQPNGKHPPFFCVHAVGGNVLEYRELAKQLGPDQPFYGLQSIVFNQRDLVPTSIERMAGHYIEEIFKVQPEGPYYIGGSSFGGTVAFEMAQQLHSKGKKVGLLALFDTHGPDYPKISTLRTVRYRTLAFIDLHLGHCQLLNYTNRLSYIYKLIKNTRHRSVNLINELNWNRRESIKETLNSIYAINRRALEEYKPRVYPGMLTLFRASEQPIDNIDTTYLGWKALVTGGIDLHHVPGYHGNIVIGANVSILANKLRDSLIKTQFQYEPS